MRAFLSELFARGGNAAYTVTVAEGGEEPARRLRRYRVRPRRVLALWAGSLLGAALLTAAALALTPLGQLVPGYGTAQMEQRARQNARHAAALEDSLRQQGRYLRHLQSLMAGPVDSAFVAQVHGRGEGQALSPLPGEQAATPAPMAARAQRRREEGPPAAEAAPEAHFAAAGFSSPASSPARGTTSAHEGSLGEIQLPVAPPAEGFVTRGFDAQTGHYAVDIAAEEGTPVRSIGDGYVVMADHTQEGGQAIAVQHAGGYLSLYKHNSRLLKRVGERVEAREVIAESGNSGEMTTGPHLHVELWHDGLAQDPAAYFIEG